MPQKANPIGSETVVGISVLAAQQVPALLAAMQAGHERAAGEWQVEWDAIPAITALGGGALAATADVIGGLQSLPRAHARQPRRRGRADHGRSGHDGRRDDRRTRPGARPRLPGVRDGAGEGLTLADAMRRELDVELVAALPPLETLLDPAQYLGETDAIVDRALEGWSRATIPARPEAGRARP